MDVMVGPTFSIDVPTSPPFAGNRPTGNVFFAGDSSESSSSIGTPDDNEDEEVQSKFKGLNSLDSLDDSLPIKKGLSNHFIGKSKSFSDLSQVTNVTELKKQENPFNKRRRLLIASKLSRKSFYSCFNPKSMPLLRVNEDEDEDDDDDENQRVDKEVTTKGSSPSSSSSSMEEKKNPQEEVMMRQLNNRMPQSYAHHMRLRLGSFKSRSFSLADLQEHDEVEEDDDDDEEQHLD
ncbi:hypothetical protein P8452_00728 [Trifolium repens]|nr:hypothetical protein P8452_00728 [Trifolium repens]